MDTDKEFRKTDDRSYTRMLRMALNVSWQSHTTNEVLYGNLPKVCDKIAVRRLKLAGHCSRHPEEVASNLILWQPTHGSVNRGRRCTTFIDVLKKDTGLENIEELKSVMQDRKLWRGYVTSVRVGTRPK